ncbi:unnamed protein product [Adineta ricciae]|uniref:Uncharacterized protein n=1 Tax=Adineta ricciae TaxID=249248 RepID=A0A815A1T5_ADIRI|nr:unnamed protein product [Adineta ricciae]CAF1249337.1 unnamed protein product [Adineta ricciae]
MNTINSGITPARSKFGQGDRHILLLDKRLGQSIGAPSTSTPKHISLSFNHTVPSHLFEALSIYFSYGYLYEQGNKRVHFANVRHLFEAKMDTVVDKSQELNKILVVRVTGDCEVKELSGIVSGDHLWLNSVNRCRFTAHVPLDDEKHISSFKPIKGSSADHLRLDVIGKLKYNNRYDEDILEMLIMRAYELIANNQELLSKSDTMYQHSESNTECIKQISLQCSLNENFDELDGLLAEHINGSQVIMARSVPVGYFLCNSGRNPAARNLLESAKTMPE